MGLRAEFFPVFGPVLDAENPFIQVLLDACFTFADIVPIDIEIIVAVIAALRIARLCTAGTMANRADDKTGDQRPVRTGADHRLINELFSGQADPFGGKGELLLLPYYPPQVSIAIRVGALDMDDGHIGIECRDRDHITT